MKLGTLCYIETNNCVLMLHRNKKKNDMHEGLWVGLGGKFENGESPEECVTREVFEESGLILHSPALRGIITFPDDAKNGDWYVFLYTASEFEGKICECSEGELAWIDWDKIHSLPMHSGDHLILKWLKEYDKDSIFSVKFIYDREKLMDYKISVY